MTEIRIIFFIIFKRCRWGCESEKAVCFIMGPVMWADNRKLFSSLINKSVASRTQRKCTQYIERQRLCEKMRPRTINLNVIVHAPLWLCDTRSSPTQFLKLRTKHVKRECVFDVHFYIRIVWENFKWYLLDGKKDTKIRLSV